MAETYNTQSVNQFGQYLDYYINGFGISNDATTPNTVINIAAGSCLDVTGSYQLTSNTVISINGAVNGLNGLDTGSLAASKVYAIYLVWDPVSFQPTGAMFSLSGTAPLMPFGYSAYLLIGYMVTDASAHILKGYWSAGNSSTRRFTFDAPQATAVTAGAATTYTAVDLSALVPNQANTPVSIAYSYTPNAANDTFKMQGALSTGDAVTITGQVTTIKVTGNTDILAQISSSKPEINYKVSSASDAVAINVAGYTWFV